MTKPSGLSEVPFEMEEEEDQEPNFDIPQSREEKPAAYPNGPICIYEAGVYLYFEPTAEQATTFDVIINVASEVKDPFISTATDSQKDIDARRVDGPPAESVDFATLSQRPKPTTSFGMQDSSPTTPKATPTMLVTPPRDVVINGKAFRTPEYIHMPWEHNTDIVPDLYKLVKIIDDKVQQGQRVLIHCQCGVSRSASLVVAYGLYKDPQMSVQDAYDRAKKRSRWIGPNMNLIMQLQEFRNGLLRQNDNRSYHNQGFGRRSAGLVSARSNGTNRYSPFDRETASGPRTPQTAPLPPDSDISMQRASTGNMMAISPGPLSAPTGAFAPGFRRSWDSSQTHFDLSSQSTPTTTPYVDPKGHVVPVLSVTDNDHSSTPAQAEPASETVQPTPETTLQPPTIPNFSRQLPLRSLDLPAEPSLPSSREVHLGLPRPLEFAALKSPAVASFNIPPLPSQQPSIESEIMSPIKTSFDVDAWPRGYDIDPQPSPLPMRTQDVAEPVRDMSPRATEFHMTGLNTDNIDESYGLLSPRATTFDLSGPAKTQPSSIDIRSFEQPEVASPIATQFPKDVFGGRDDTLDDDLKSPRSTEFHMTPLKPRIADEDPFGLTSPTRVEFSSTRFAVPIPVALQEKEEDRRPSFQAILPPSHQTFNGFASLDGTAKTQPTFQPFISTSAFSTRRNPEAEPRIDSLSTFPETATLASVEPAVPYLENVPEAPETPQVSNHTFLSTPAKAIRTRFSSPNMREQRKLHKLQTEIESKLSKPPVAQHAADDIDALMSPRAEEFTRNPFHFDLRGPGDDTSPASSNETIKDGRNGHDWIEPLPRQWTPEKATVDPRSPVQTGSSPIVRNIWDVL